MKHVMVHPNGINTREVGPVQAKELAKNHGWREKTNAPEEVLKFQQAQKDKITEFCHKKASESETIVEPEVIKPDVQNNVNPQGSVPPVLPPAYDVMTKKELVDIATKKGGIEKDLNKLNKAAIIEFIKSK